MRLPSSARAGPAYGGRIPTRFDPTFVAASNPNVACPRPSVDRNATKAQRAARSVRKVAVGQRTQL